MLVALLLAADQILPPCDGPCSPEAVAKCSLPTVATVTYFSGKMTPEVCCRFQNWARSNYCYYMYWQRGPRHAAKLPRESGEFIS